jgi:hypothetical protein
MPQNGSLKHLFYYLHGSVGWLSPPGWFSCFLWYQAWQWSGMGNGGLEYARRFTDLTMPWQGWLEIGPRWAQLAPWGRCTALSFSVTLGPLLLHVSSMSAEGSPHCQTSCQTFLRLMPGIVTVSLLPYSVGKVSHKASLDSTWKGPLTLKREDHWGHLWGRATTMVFSQPPLYHHLCS